MNIVKEIEIFINENITSNIDIEIVSNHFGYSQSHLNRLFKSIHNISINQYIIDVRLSFSSTLLIGTSLSISEIADYVNYQSIEAFTRAFKKKYGKAPYYYRKERQQKCTTQD